MLNNNEVTACVGQSSLFSLKHLLSFQCNASKTERNAEKDHYVQTHGGRDRVSDNYLVHITPSVSPSLLFIHRKERDYHEGHTVDILLKISP